MDAPRVVNQVGPDQLRALLEAEHERDYLLVDVRQPREYEAGHIPGATLLPLPELEARLYSLPDDRKLVFYCRSGGRSAAAAALAGEGEVTEKPIYNLVGGILGWNGAVLADRPQVELLDRAGSPAAMLYAAMNLEKGAWRFYRRVGERFADDSWSAVFRTLVAAETAHARTVYGFWAGQQAEPLPFDALFAQLPGEILEGGTPLETALERMAAVSAQPCLRLTELALGIEYAAYDLYRSAAERAAGPVREALLSIAQAEKSHMRVLIRALAQCETDEASSQ